MEDRLQITRLVTTEEAPWLKKDLQAGTIVYEFFGVTYGCIGPDGIACTKEPDKTPFFEVPRNAVRENEM